MIGARDLATEVPASGYIIPASAGKQPTGGLAEPTRGGDDNYGLPDSHIERRTALLE